MFSQFITRKAQRIVRGLPEDSFRKSEGKDRIFIHDFFAFLQEVSELDRFPLVAAKGCGSGMTQHQRQATGDPMR
jgi:hypothetical protein